VGTTKVKRKTGNEEYRESCRWCGDDLKNWGVERKKKTKFTEIDACGLGRSLVKTEEGKEKGKGHLALV